MNSKTLISNHYIKPRPEPDFATGGLHFFAKLSVGEIGKISRDMMATGFVAGELTRKQRHCFETFLYNLLSSAIYGVECGFLIRFTLPMGDSGPFRKVFGREARDIVVNWFIDQGFVQHKDGYRAKGKAKGLSTKFWASQRFLDFMAGYNLRAQGVLFQELRDWTPIKINKQDSNLSSRGFTKELTETRILLSKLNGLLEKTKLDVIESDPQGYDFDYPGNASVAKSEWISQFPTLYPISNPISHSYPIHTPIIPLTPYTARLGGSAYKIKALTVNFKTHNLDPKLTKFTRVYTGNYSCGGRFYSSIQNIPRELRATLRLNGNSTVELDFKSLHPNLVYSQKGLTAPADCYAIPGVSRKLAKLVLLVAFNCKSRKEAIKSIKNEARKPQKVKEQVEQASYNPRIDLTDIDLNQVLDKVQETHKSISDAFYYGVGAKLQKIDSRIATLVMKHFLDQGILCLPVHDSFIVEQKYASELQNAMLSAYSEVLGLPGSSVDRKDLDNIIEFGRFSFEIDGKKWFSSDGVTYFAVNDFISETAAAIASFDDLEDKDYRDIHILASR